jgi:thioredoxin domain-containing protein 5
MIGLVVWFISLFTLGLSSDVVILDTKNFEHLTQASTGATTGDWLVKFYAPWCGHCKKMEPLYENVAESLKGEVNVAKVDVTANRELGTRFEIKGFPTIKLLSKGKVYTFKGRRAEKDLIEFARGGYQIHEAEVVNPPLGMFGEVMFVYRHAYKMAVKDLKERRFFTRNVFLAFLPALFVVSLLVLCLYPSPKYEPPPKRRSRKEIVEEEEEEDEGVTQRENAAPPTSATDTGLKQRRKDE